MDLARFSLGLLLAAFAFPCGAAAEPSVAVQVHVSMQGVSSKDAAATDLPVRAVAVWYGKGKVEPRTVELTPSKPVTLSLAPGRWVLAAEAAGFWGSEHPIEVTAEAAGVGLNLWPAGRVEGGFLLPDKESAPPQLMAFFRPAPGVVLSQAPPASKVVCPVEKGTWHCSLPAGSFDIRFQTEGFIPRYQWGVAVPKGKTLSLGRLDLRRGSAVQGWVVTADGSGVGDKARIELRPRMGGPVHKQEEARRLEALTFTAAVHPRGFFQLAGVPPGAYVLEARHERFAPAVTTVRVVAGEVTEIVNPPLTLDLPKTLEVYLTPPLDPWEKPWSLRLLRLDRSSTVLSSLALEPAESGGVWKKAGLAPGQYLLKIGPHTGDTWQVDEVEVGPDLAPLHVDLDVVQVQGTVHLGKNPLAATLSFGGRWGAVRIQAQADEDGKFQVFLPRPGTWSLLISSLVPPVTRELPEVEVRPKPGKDIAEIAVHLPTTKLLGRVVDESGAAVAGAQVSVRRPGTSPEPRIQQRADEDGRFELLGLPEGSLQVGADASDDRSSDLMTVEVAEDRETPPVTLTVRPQLRISGTVISSDGAVAGAKIKAAPAGLPYFGALTVTSDAQGNFEVSLPPRSREMFLAVGAPGFAFRLLRLPVPEDRRMAVGVAQAAGTLIVETEAPHDLLPLDSPRVFVFQGGAFEFISYLRAWAVASGLNQESQTRSVIPFVEPGDYRACWVTPAEKPGLDFGIVPEGRCAQGFLPPNGELTLKLPALRLATSGR